MNTNLKDLLKKIENTDVSQLKDLKQIDEPLKQMYKALVQAALKGEMTDHLGYDKYERSDSDNSRNGKSKKTLKTSIGEIDIDVPRDRKGDFEPQIVEKHKTIQDDIDAKIISMYARGMSLRDINEHLEEIYGIEISATRLSEITDKVMPVITEWQGRVLEKVYAIVYLDAIHYKVKQDNRIVTKAIYLCLGIGLDGMKDVLGIWVGENESSKFWLSVLNDLKNRGVEDILIACIDGLSGFSDAIKMVFPKTEIQLCIIHQIRNSMRYIPHKHKKEFMRDLKEVYKASTEELAFQNLEKLHEKWGSKYAAVIKSWREKWSELSTYFKYPPEIRHIIYTTNTLEGLNRQIRKVTKAKSVFPTDDAVLKIIYLAINNIRKKWTISVRRWTMCLNELSIFFEGRLDINKISL